MHQLVLNAEFYGFDSHQNNRSINANERNEVTDFQMCSVHYIAFYRHLQYFIKDIIFYIGITQLLEGNISQRLLKSRTI